jgi:hypothetical protein
MKLRHRLLAAVIASMAMAASSHAATIITTDGFNIGTTQPNPDQWGASYTVTAGQWSLSQTASGGGRVVAGDPFGYGGQATPQEGTGQAQFSNGGNTNFTAASITDTVGHGFSVGDEVTMLFYLAGRVDGTAAATLNVSLVGAQTISLGSFTAVQGDNSWVLTTSNTATITTAGTYNVQFTYGNAADDVDRTTYLDSVSYSVIPEPSAALLGGLGLIALLRRCRA